jgi:hypothetical protein
MFLSGPFYQTSPLHSGRGMSVFLMGVIQFVACVLVQMLRKIKNVFTVKKVRDL